MTNEDRAPFAAMLTLIAEQYGKPMSPELIGLYFDALADLSLADVRRALTAHVRNTDIGQFMPKVADIARALEGNSESAAYTQFALVSAGFTGSGAQGEIDEIALQVVSDMGGWRAIGMRDSEEWQSFGLKDFVKRYQIYKDRVPMNDEQKLLEAFDRKLLDKANP